MVQPVIVDASNIDDSLQKSKLRLQSHEAGDENGENRRWGDAPPGLASISSSSSSSSSDIRHRDDRANPPSNNIHHATGVGQPITPLRIIPYVHGGYAAAAPLFITHSKFASILKRLLPESYLELKGLLQRLNATTVATTPLTTMNEEGDVDLLLKYSMNNDLIDHSASTDKQQKSLLTLTDPVKIMKWAENNPIVSAFGIWNSNNGRFNNGSKNLERLSMMQKIGGVFPVHGGGESGSGVVNYDHDDKTDGAHHRCSFLHSSSSMSSSLPPTTTSTTDLNITQQRRCDRSGNISMAGAVMTATTTTQTMTPTATMRNNSNDGGSSNSSTSSGITQQHLSSYQQRLQQQQRQQQRKRESSNSNRCVSPLPPLPPQHATRMIQSPPPLPPGSKLLMGGGMSGFGGVSSPRRKIPLPSDLPNSTTTTTDVAMAATLSPSNNANTTSYDANYYHLDDNHHHQNQYNRRNSTASSASFSCQQSPPTLATRQHQQQQQQQHRYSKPAIEWDIFLDPQLVRHVDAALTIVDDLECNIRNIRITREQNRQMKRRQREDEHQRYLKQLEVMKCCRMNGGGFGSGAGVRGVGGVGGVMTDSTTSLEGGSNYDDDDDDDEIYDDEEDFDLLQSHTAAQVEVDRLVSQLMRRTIIAHGSMSQLVLEGLGWAPEYNFGRVVRCSREGTNLPSPQRRNGHHHCSSISNNTYYSNKNYSTFSWDEEEEQRDFEALLDRRLVGSVGGGGGGSATGNTTGATDAGKGSNSTHYSRGMFMEKWLSLFAKSLTLLERSTTNTNSSFGGGSNDIAKLSSSSSSSSSNSRRKKKNDDNALLLLQKKNKKSVTKKPVDEGGGGLTNYFRSFFFSPEKRSSSIGIVEEDFDSDDIIDQEKGAKNNDDDASCYLTNNDMFSPATSTTSTGFLGRFSCGLSLCLVGVDDTCGPSTCQTSNNYSVFPHNPHASHQMARDIQQIHDVLGEPLRLVLDLKSRRVPPRVWSRLIDNLRSRGLIVEGVGSFDMDELRTIGKGCSYPLTPILFFHSVGDLQHACHANEIKRGDTVYFNGGSLMWKRSSIMEAAECEGCCGAFKLNRDNDDDDDNDIKPRAYDRSSSTATAATMSSRTLNANGKYSFQPYAYPRSALSDWERVMCKSTIEDYRRYFHLKIGVYVQEFSISAEALDELTVFINENGDLYDQGLAFGGVNGVAVKNISGDGYWNQRYMGRSWDFNARPSKEMTPLKPEDHHLVQVAIQAGAWGQVGTIYEVNDEQTGALTVPPPREPCQSIDW